MKTCQCCSKEFDEYPVIDGKKRNLSNRIYCLECSPFGTKDKRHPKDRATDADGCRTCSTCKERKPLDLEHFPASTTEKTGFRWECKACAAKRTIKRQKDQKQKCLDYKGSKCCVCGYDKTPRSLHFHHVNPTEKEFTLAKYRMRSWEETKTELDKCVLLCANCHGEVHDGLIDLSLLPPLPYRSSPSS